MTLEEYKRQRANGNNQLLEEIKSAFIRNGVVTVHQFGSGAHGFIDEFSDLVRN